MPQISLEYTDNLTQEINTAKIFRNIHQVLGEVAGIPLANCKSRANRLNDFYIADGDSKNAFIHLEVRFIEGRSAEIRSEIGEQCLEQLQAYFAESVSSQNLQITVEIHDIHKPSYFKFPKGTL